MEKGKDLKSFSFLYAAKIFSLINCSIALTADVSLSLSQCKKCLAYMERRFCLLNQSNFNNTRKPLCAFKQVLITCDFPCALQL